MTQIPLECVYCLKRGTALVDVDNAEMGTLVQALVAGLPVGWSLVKQPSPMGSRAKVACPACSRAEEC